MIQIFWRTIWNHLVLMVPWAHFGIRCLNMLWFQTLAQYLQAVAQRGLSHVCGASAVPPCLPLITSIWAGSTLHTRHHTISDGWLMRERRGMRGEEAERDRWEQNGLRRAAGGRVSGEESHKLSGKKRRCELKTEDTVAERGKERMQMWPGMLSRAPPSWSSFLPSEASCTPPWTNPQVTPQSHYTSFLLPLSFTSKAETPPGFHAQAWKSLLLRFIFLFLCLHVLFQLHRIYHPPPAWKELTLAFSEESVSLLSDGFKPKRAEAAESESI